jgi:serine/threonine protein kinase
VIYRDLKPENILIFEDGYPRLADFGVAAKYDDDDDVYFEMKGTILYFAPEVVQKKGYDRAIDFWALGVLAYELTFKQPPFSTSYISSPIYEKKINERIKDDNWPHARVSKQMKDFINKLLVINPTNRLGYDSF